MQILIPEQATEMENTEEVAAPEEIFDLTIDVEPYLPDQVIPFWNFLQDYPLLLVVMMFILGYGAGKTS